MKYSPQVVLNNQSLFTLLNNHGLNYKEQWEIPVCIKMIPVAGIVYFCYKNYMFIQEVLHIFFIIPFHLTEGQKMSKSSKINGEKGEDSLD